VPTDAANERWCRKAVVSTDRKLLSTLSILAAAVLGWTAAIDLEIGWAVIAGLAAALDPMFAR
jgi:hypothetical protein